MDKRARFLLIAPEKTIPLPVGNFVVGRGPEADIVFERGQLSRRHARLVVSLDSVDVEDLGSTNGTWVNSYLVQHRLSVKNSARLKLGDLMVTLQQAREHQFRDPESSQTARDGIPRSGPGQAHILTQPTSAFEHLRSSLLELIEQKQFESVKKSLDPVLAEIELSSRPLGDGALEGASEVALRLALTVSDATYVDAVVRIYQANDALMNDDILTLLDECMVAGLEPDPRNAEEYLDRIAGALGEVRAKRIARTAEALDDDDPTIPAPAPDSQR